uniref:Uncharacterized protein n=1 Tax=Arundo donax TaxID=35708 RepID=A0A0A9BFP0_ARUDO
MRTEIMCSINCHLLSYRFTNPACSLQVPRFEF